MRLGFRSGGTLKCRIDGRLFLAIATTTALVVVFLISFYSVAIAPGIYWPPQQEMTEMTVQQESQRGAVSSQRKLLSHENQING
ncbi:hypothetical protein FCM35_KLT21075 [Carex littledalei]|uniref:Uncharacterized protein n=1 Tax=Carex littledalei TaxID=544730 RepID=A0A833R7E2_9POAL|nr:hypothetical protein FCM35_KLT21075 [Carex littledalei]